MEIKQTAFTSSTWCDVRSSTVVVEKVSSTDFKHEMISTQNCVTVPKQNYNDLKAPKIKLKNNYSAKINVNM